MRQGTASQHYRCQDDQTQRISAEDQGVGAYAISVEDEVVERVLLQHDGIIDRKRLGNHLNGRSAKGNRAKRAAQEEQGNRYSEGEREDRLAHFQECTLERSKGNKYKEGEQRKSVELSSVYRQF